MGFQEVLMKDGLKFFEDAGAEPAGEGPTSRTEALGDAEGVSTGRRFIRTLVVIANKTSLHGRVPPKRKMQDTTEKISLEPSKQMRQVLKKMLQGGKEMKGEPLQMEEFPGGSSGSVPASAAGREAMPGTGTGDEVASPSAWMNKVLKPLEPPADVSTGRTSPAPTLHVALKPSSHHSGKVQDTTDKMSLQPSKQMRKELKEPLQTREEMDIELQWKVAIPEGSTPSSMRAPAAGRKAMPDTGTGTADWDAGTVPPLAWRSEVVKPSGHSAAVSAGTTPPTPTLDAAHKPSSHGRGPLTGETKDMAGKKFLDPIEIMWQMLKERLQRRQEIKGEPGEKEAFPRGSRGSMPASAAGREAMPGTGTGDEAGKASPSAWMNKVLKPLEPPADVSTGRTSPASPAPTLDAIRKPSSHHSVTPTGKIQDTTDKMSLQPSKQIRQELKEPLQTREEMDIVLQWKVAFLEGSTPSSVRAPAAGKKAKTDTGTGTADWDAGNDSPLAWRSEVVKPSEHSSDISGATTSPTPTLDAAHKPSSHGRGPLTGETKDMAGKKFQDPLEIMWQMLKECLQKRKEMNGEPVLKEAFPGGSSGSLPASAAGREAMPGTGTGDEGAGKASPSAWMNNVLKPLEPPADVSTGRTSPALTLDAALMPSSHHRGTPTGKIQDRTDKISLESPKEMRQELKELLQTRQEMDIGLQWKVAFLEGSTPSSMPAPAAGKKAKPDTGTGTADWDAGKNSPLAWRSEVVKPSGHSADVSAGTPSTTPTLDAAQKPSSHGRGPPPEEIKDMAGKKFQNPLEITWQMLKDVLQGGQDSSAGEGVHGELPLFPAGVAKGCVPHGASRRLCPVRIHFSPEENKDYSHELTCITTRGRIVVPIRAIAARAVLDFPEQLDFSRCPVKSSSQKTLLLHNSGNLEARFQLSTQRQSLFGQSQRELCLEKLMEEKETGKEKGSCEDRAALLRAPGEMAKVHQDPMFSDDVSFIEPMVSDS
ncbi:uncharacterized protein LOC135309330 [Passer domesticus]|uniref:uncharacterized protein LOC135309330 n=1 Tax=Passer domesticus TaxID=48849 RepID=UPI0030FEEF12